MKLSDYNKKRNFAKTTEPVGKLTNSKNNRFVVQYHRATTNHYDFRLEYLGVLVSFAVPKGLPKSGEKKLAIHVEDHPIDYINFEGTIPKGEYGAGTVEIFDKGTYEQIGSFRSGFKSGKLKFCLFGDKSHGIYNLIKMDEKNWLMIKDKDEELQNKIKSEEKVKNNNKKTSKSVKNPFNSVDVKLCMLTNKVPKSKNYIFEIKYDGYRIVAFVDKNKVVLKTRNNLNFTSKFNSIVENLKSLNKTMVLDGEIVIFDKNGKTDFGLLQKSIKNDSSQCCYIVFDILALDGVDLRNKPLKERKILLEENLKKYDNVLLSEFVKENGQKVFNFAKKNKLEGIVAKNVNSVYNNKRDNDWLKIKCYLRQEFVIVGYSTTQKNKLLSAVYLGYYNKEQLIYIGKAGTGFSETQKKDLNEKFKKLETKSYDIKNLEISKDKIHFLKPKLVAEIQFAEITHENRLRQASFIALREDKKAKNVVLEKINIKN